MLQISILLLTFSLGLQLPLDYRAICYVIYASGKHYKIYALKSLNFDFEKLILEISYTETGTESFKPIKYDQTFYLLKVPYDCQSERLEFKKIGDDPQSRANIEIKLSAWVSQPFEVEYFQVLLDNNHGFAEIILEGKYQHYAMVVAITKNPSLVQSEYNPGTDFQTLRELNEGEYYCLKLLKYGKDVLDTINLSFKTSKLEQYVKVKANLRVLEGEDYELKEVIRDFGELSVCSSIPMSLPFQIFIQTITEAQRVDVEIENLNEKTIKTSFRILPNEMATPFSDETTNWRSFYLFVSQVSVSFAKNIHPKEGIVLFETEEISDACEAHNERSYFTKKIAENEILYTESYGYLPACRATNIFVGQVINQEEFEQLRDKRL